MSTNYTSHILKQMFVIIINTISLKKVGHCELNSGTVA